METTATAGSGAPDKPKSPWLRNIGAVLLGFFGISGVMSALLVGAWMGVAVASILVLIAWLVSSFGKAWRSAHRVPL